ncbi:hypothetical protein J5N97_001493 [Dioscorea zingiberensis]|uniref:Tr-type G domain-containing protein n=1 Tax=Dioscorea zingiberensis TaxID=325984 RepID=A0A9D5H2A4_9LILI|nr:hypothetical protein J5N97_001493 [Dioscorea zingiberensis]
MRDKSPAEKEHGNTNDADLLKFKTSKSCYTILEVPGHRDFFESMTRTLQADCAMINLDLTMGSYEAVILEYDQAWEHAFIVFALGGKQMLCYCKTMEITTLKCSRARHEDMVKEVPYQLQKVQYNHDNTPFSPISMFKDDNRIERSTHLDGYKGPTPLESPDMIQEPKRLSNKFLRLGIQTTHLKMTQGDLVTRVAMLVGKEGYAAMLALEESNGAQLWSW